MQICKEAGGRVSRPQPLIRRLGFTGRAPDLSDERLADSTVYGLDIFGAIFASTRRSSRPSLRKAFPTWAALRSTMPCLPRHSVRSTTRTPTSWPATDAVSSSLLRVQGGAGAMIFPAPSPRTCALPGCVRAVTSSSLHAYRLSPALVGLAVRRAPRLGCYAPRFILGRGVGLVPGCRRD